jgi:CRP-like cAMP-binding protein
MGVLSPAAVYTFIYRTISKIPTRRTEMADGTSSELLAGLSKLPLFQGLALDQVGSVLAVAAERAVSSGEKICINGSPKDEMFLLTAGELAILNGKGMRVATINAVATVGELSVIAGQPHSATIEVSQPGTLLTIKKANFQQMLDDQPETKSAILQNVIQILASRLMQVKRSHA